MINRTIRYLPEGTRILVHDSRKSSSLSFASIRVNPNGQHDLITANGDIYINQGHGSFQRAGQSEDSVVVAWAGPFPKLSEDAIIAYYKSLFQVERRRKSSFDPALLIQLTEVSDEICRGKIVEGSNSQPRYGKDEDESEYFSSGHIHVSKRDLLISSAGIPATARKGDLLISSDLSCQADVNADKSLTYIVTLENATILGNALSIHELRPLVPDDDSEERNNERDKLGFTFHSFDIMSAGDVRHHEDAARAKTEPDLGLFVSIPDERGECYPAFITGSGINLFGHSLRGIEDLLKTPCPPQGVWAFENPVFWAGSYDTDIGREWDEALNGTFVPATAEHLKQLDVSMEELGETIIEYMRDSGHDVRGKALECAAAWMELAPSYASEQTLSI